MEVIATLTMLLPTRIVTNRRWGSVSCRGSSLPFYALVDEAVDAVLR